MTLKSGIKLGIFSLFTFVSFSFAESYTIQKGDTIEKIAKKFNVPQEEIIKVNNIKDPKKLREGQKIEIPTTIKRSSKEDGKRKKSSREIEEVYEVQPGDTLEKIAKKYNISVKDIMEYNDMRDERIFAGDQIKIPLSPEALRKRKMEQARKSIDLSKCEIYTLKRGGTLKHVSKRTGIDINTLEKLNNIDRSQWLEAGTNVCIGEKKEREEISRTDCELFYKPKEKVSISEISRKFNVSQEDIKRINKLSNNYVNKGQTICIKLYEGELSSLETKKYKYYRVKRGETISDVAQKFGTTVDEIKELNNLKREKLYTGQKLKVPLKEESKVVQAQQEKQGTPAKPLLPKEIKPKVDSSEIASVNGIKLGWPVNGKVIAGFQNDENVRHLGIEIASECGQNVKAAESGKVVYAGDGIKAFGNIVVIRHDNGLTTVYGYLDKLLVNEGMRVSKGESIGVVGKLKNSDNCGIYFEVRKNVTPIDPQKVLE